MGRNNFSGIVGIPPLKKVMTYDEVIKDFHRRKAAGEVFCNPFSSTTIEHVHEGSYSGSWFIQNNYPQLETYNHVRTMGDRFNTSSYPDVSIDVGDAVELTRIGALGSVNGTEVDLGNFMIEWEKTRSIHRDLGNTILKLATEEATKYRRGSQTRHLVYDRHGNPVLNRNGEAVYRYSGTPGRFSGRSRTSAGLKGMSDIYLAIRMGILPLISDLQGALKILSDNKAFRRTARGQQVFSKTASDIQYVGERFGKTWSVHRQVTRMMTFRSGILYESSVLGRTLGQLGLTRPLSTVWESLPWSFVADWFLQVGNWLDAIQPSGASKTLAAWDSFHEVLVYSMVVSDSFNYEDDNQRYTISWKESILQTEKRNVRSVWDGIIPVHPLPGGGFSMTRSADFAALILQRLRF